MEFELDAAYPAIGEPISIGIDVKSISHRRDLHKRADEIVNKAEKFKSVYPNGKFGAVIYYPFDGQANVAQRLRVSVIDGIVFALDSKQTIEEAILMLLPQVGIEVHDNEPGVTLFDETTGQ